MNYEIMMMITKNGLAEGNLVGVNGNAFAVLGYTKERLRKANWPSSDIFKVMAIAKRSDYDNLLCTCVSVLEGDDY
tara:strand:- start:1138 stop:1365 length:228 start_codon:yes stop_codon:yes gene_type:complete